eukprot:8869069-Lingulodinium_polyedra.AAC.1
MRLRAVLACELPRNAFANAFHCRRAAQFAKRVSHASVTIWRSTREARVLQNAWRGSNGMRF